uniref:C3H1-type domain-containing protein n=1 Tax=Timema bartmani TaxID=61472 RepID=A0A7R9ERE5_9NEOP|nr:unnamed protein product [Timema bartmani]
MAQNTFCGAPATAIETTSQEQTQNNSHHIIYNRTIHVNPKLSALHKNKEFIQKLLAENKTQPVRPHSIYFNPKFLVNKPKERDSNNARLLLRQHNQRLDPSSRRETNANQPFVMKQLSRNALNELKFSNGSSCENNQSKGPHSAVVVPINFYEKPKSSLETNITNLEESNLPKQSHKNSSSKESKPNEESNCHLRFALDESKSLEQLYDIARSSLGRSKKNPYLNYDARHPSHNINSPTHLRPVVKSSSEGLRLLNSTQDIFQIEKPKRKSHSAHSNSNLKSHSVTGLKRKILKNVPETSMFKKDTPTSNKITSLEAPSQVGLLNTSIKQVYAISDESQLMDEGKTTNLDCSSFVVKENVQRPDECLTSLKESNDAVLENPSLLHGGTPEQNSSDSSVFKVPVDIPPRKKSAEKTAEERYMKRVEYLKLRRAKSSRTTSTASFAPRLIGSGKASKLKHLGLIIQKKKMCNDFSDDDNNTTGEGRSYLTDLACDCMSSEALAKTPRSRYKRRVKAANCIYDCDTKDSQVPMPNWDQNVHDVNSRVSEWLSSSPDVSSFEVNVNTTCSKGKLSSKSKSNEDKINRAQSGKSTEDPIISGSSSRDSSRTRQKREESKRVNQPNFSYNGSDSHSKETTKIRKPKYFLLNPKFSNLHFLDAKYSTSSNMNDECRIPAAHLHNDERSFSSHVVSEPNVSPLDLRVSITNMHKEHSTPLSLNHNANVSLNLDQKYTVPLDLDRTYSSPSNLGQTYPVPSNLDQTYTAPSNLDQTYTAPSNLDQTYTALPNLDQTYTAPQNLGQTYTALSNSSETYISPSNLDQVCTTPSNLSQTLTTPSNLDQKHKTPSILDQICNMPSHLDRKQSGPSNLEQINRISSTCLKNACSIPYKHKRWNSSPVHMHKDCNAPLDVYRRCNQFSKPRRLAVLIEEHLFTRFYSERVHCLPDDIVMQLQNIGLERDVNLLSNEIATQIRNISMERNDTNCCEVGMEDFDISDVYPMFQNMPTEDDEESLDGKELDESLCLKDKPPYQNLEQKIQKMTSNDEEDDVYKNDVDVNKPFSPNQDDLTERKDNFSCHIFESESADMEIDDETKVGSSSGVDKPESPVISNDTKEEIPQTPNVQTRNDIATGIEYRPSLVQSSHVDLPKNLNSEESYFVKSKTKLIRQSSTSKSLGYSGTVKRNSPSNLKIKRSGSLVSVSKTKLVRKNSSSVGKTSSPLTFSNKRRLPTRGGKKLVRMLSQTCNSSFMSVSTTKLVRIRKPSLTSVRSQQTPKARRRTSVSSPSSSVKATKSMKTKYSLSRCSPNHPSCRKSPHHTLRRVCLKSKYKIDRRAEKASRLVVKKVKKYSLKYEGVRRGDSGGTRKAKTKVQYSGKDASYRFVKQLGSINRVWRNAADCFNPQKIVVTNRKLQRIGRSPTNADSQNLKRKSNLVQIGGMLYKCTRNKLTRTPASKISETAGAGAVEKRGHVLYVRGDKFIMDSAGKTMRRIPADGGLRENVPLKRGARTRIDIGGVTFLQKSPNVLIRTETHKARSILSQAKQKSIAILTQKMRKSNELCMFYQRFGKCSKKEKGLCPKVHDPKRIAVCRKFLLGKCELVACPLSHEVVPEKMPTCRYFLEAVCVRDNCPYLHVKHNPKTDICLGFLQGYCSQGEKCQKRHENMCPEFDKYGKCSRGKFCSYPHKSNTKQPSKSPARSSKTSIRKTRRAAEPKPERRRYYQDNDKKQESQTALHDDGDATGKETESQVDQKLSLVDRHDNFDITDSSSDPTSAPCEESKVMGLKCHPMPNYISLN